MQCIVPKWRGYVKRLSLGFLCAVLLAPFHKFSCGIFLHFQSHTPCLEKDWRVPVMFAILDPLHDQQILNLLLLGLEDLFA